MNENSLKQVKAVINARKTALTEEEARELAIRAVQFKKERGRLPEVSSNDPWERRMAEGIAFLQRKVSEGSDD